MTSRRPRTLSYSGNGRTSSEEEGSSSNTRSESRNTYLSDVRAENRSTLCSVMAQLTEDIQPTFETTLKSKAISEKCNVKFTCVVSGFPAPELTWYKDDMEMDRYCGLPKYEIFRNGKTHSLHIYNCTLDDAAIYQASASNSKGIVSCSGVLEVGTMNEYQIHQRFFAKLKQKAENKKKELEESRKKGRESVQKEPGSPERSQRKRPVQTKESPAAREAGAAAITQIEAAASEPNGVGAKVLGPAAVTHTDIGVEKVAATEDAVATKKIKISNCVEGVNSSSNGRSHSIDNGGENSYDGGISLSHFLAETLSCQATEEKRGSPQVETPTEMDTCVPEISKEEERENEVKCREVKAKEKETQLAEEHERLKIIEKDLPVDREKEKKQQTELAHSLSYSHHVSDTKGHRKTHKDHDPHNIQASISSVLHTVKDFFFGKSKKDSYDHRNKEKENDFPVTHIQPPPSPLLRPQTEARMENYTPLSEDVVPMESLASDEHEHEVLQREDVPQPASQSGVYSFEPAVGGSSEAASMSDSPASIEDEKVPPAVSVTEAVPLTVMFPVTDEPQPSLITGEPQPSLITGEPQPSLITGEPQPSPRTGEPQPSPRTGEPQPSPRTGEPQPSPRTGEPQPSPRTGEPQPSPRTHEPQPSPRTHEHQPSPRTHEPQPSPRTGELQPSPRTHEPQPSPRTGEPQPSPRTHEPQPSPRTHEHQPSPRTHEPQPSPRTGELQPSPRTHEPQPSPRTGEPQPSPRTHEPQPSPRTGEPQPSPRTHEPQPSPRTHEPQPSPRTGEPQPSPRTHEPQPSPRTHLSGLPQTQTPHEGAPPPASRFSVGGSGALFPVISCLEEIASETAKDKVVHIDDTLKISHPEPQENYNESQKEEKVKVNAGTLCENSHVTGLRIPSEDSENTHQAPVISIESENTPPGNVERSDIRKTKDSLLIQEMGIEGDSTEAWENSMMYDLRLQQESTPHALGSTHLRARSTMTPEQHEDEVALRERLGSAFEKKIDSVNNLKMEEQALSESTDNKRSGGQSLPVEIEFEREKQGDHFTKEKQDLNETKNPSVAQRAERPVSLSEGDVMRDAQRPVSLSEGDVMRDAQRPVSLSEGDVMRDSERPVSLSEGDVMRESERPVSLSEGDVMEANPGDTAIIRTRGFTEIVPESVMLSPAFEDITAIKAIVPQVLSNEKIMQTNSEVAETEIKEFTQPLDSLALKSEASVSKVPLQNHSVIPPVTDSLIPTLLNDDTKPSTDKAQEGAQLPNKTHMQDTGHACRQSSEQVPEMDRTLIPAINVSCTDENQVRVPVFTPEKTSVFNTPQVDGHSTVPPLVIPPVSFISDGSPLKAPSHNERSAPGLGGDVSVVDGDITIKCDQIVSSEHGLENSPPSMLNGALIRADVNTEAINISVVTAARGDSETCKMKPLKDVKSERDSPATETAMTGKDLRPDHLPAERLDLKTSPASLRRFFPPAAPRPETPTLMAVPAITVDNSQSDKTGEELSGGSTPTSSLSCESSPRMKRRDSLSLIRSATPEELASGARRKIFIPRAKGEDGDGAGFVPGAPDTQVKRDSPYMSPGQARRASLLQAPTGQHTPPMERRSPLLNRRKALLEVPKVVAETPAEQADGSRSEEKPAEKEKLDPFKAPQVIRKIRGEAFPDAAGHLKLWCQFFNILSDSTIKWFRDEEEILEVKRSGGDESQVALAIVQASSQDCGVYGCSIRNEYGTDTTDLLLSVDILSEMLLKEDLEVGEEIEMTPMMFTKGLADSGCWADKLFGRIMTKEAHVGQGCAHKACRAKVIYGLEPIFESGSSCIMKVQSPIAYGTKEESNLTERNLEITKQECKVQNLIREYCKVFAAEARVIEMFGFSLEVLPQYLMYRPANSVPYATVESDLDGVFLQYCTMDAKGRLMSRTISEVEQKCCSFQHWIHQWTHGNLLVTRLEGVGTKLTNVRVVTKSKGYQGLTEQGSPKVFEQFLAQHQCNYYCGLLSLSSLKTADSLQQPSTKIKGSRSPLLGRRSSISSSSPQQQRRGINSPQMSRKATSSPKVLKKIQGTEDNQVNAKPGPEETSEAVLRR